MNEKDTTSFSSGDFTKFNSGFSVSTKSNLRFSKEIFSNVRCPMNIRYFPHDVQHCTLEFTSYLHKRDIVIFLHSFY